MENEKQKWQELTGIDVLVKATNYDVANDSRYLIPFKQVSWRENKFGLLDRDGNIVVPAIYDKILDECYSPSDLIRVSEQYTKDYGKPGKPNIYTYDKIGLINAKGKKLIEPAYNELVLSSDQQYVTVKQDGKTAILNAQLEEIVPWGKYSFIGKINRYGFARFNCQFDENDHSVRKWGIVDIYGNEIVPAECNTIWALDDQYPSAVLEIDGKRELLSYQAMSEIQKDILKTSGENTSYKQYLEYFSGMQQKFGLESAGVLSNVDIQSIIEEKTDLPF